MVAAEPGAATGRLDVVVNGLPVLHRGLSNSVTANQFKSLGLALALVLVILCVLYRSLSSGLLAATPTALTLLFVYGLMGAAGVASLTGIMSELLHPSLEDRIQPLMAASDPPLDDLSGSQAGTRLQGRFGAVDLGIMYFYGWDKFPVTRLNTEILGTVTGLLEDARAVMGFYGDHPEVLSAMTGIDLDDPASLLAMAEIMGDLAEDPEDKAQFYATMDAIERLVAAASELPEDLTVNDVFRTGFRRRHVLGADLAAVLFDEVGRPRPHKLKAVKTRDGLSIQVELRDWKDIVVIEE